MILSHENPTPSAAYHKIIYASNIKMLTPEDPLFWKNFVKYMTNLYVSQSEYDEMI